MFNVKDRDPLAQTQQQETNSVGAVDPQDRAQVGVGMAQQHMIKATREGKFPNDNTSGLRSQGEIAGSGSIYAAVLTERPNTSNPRNQGPERPVSRMGASSIPIATVSDRNTGRVS